MEKVMLVAVMVGILSFVSIPEAVRGEDVCPPPNFDVKLVDYPKTIEPGGSYYIVVRVTRPSGMPLPAWTSGEEPPKWEVRVYFYSGLNCYNKGEGSGGLYTGWWNWREIGDNWTENMPDTREFKIRVEVVDYPRPATDEMAELPLGGEISLKARLRIRWGGTEIEFEDIDGDNKSELLFTYNGVRYGGDYRMPVYPTRGLFEVDGINLQRTRNYWHIDYDETITVAVAGSEELPQIIWMGPFVVVVIVAVMMFLKKKHALPIKFKKNF